MDRRPKQIVTVTRQVHTGAIDAAESILLRTWQDDVDAPPPKVTRSSDVSRPTEAQFFGWVSRQQSDVKKFCGLVVGDVRTVGLLEICEDLDRPYEGDISGDVEFLSRGDPTRSRWPGAIGAVTGAAVDGARLACDGWQAAYRSRFVEDGRGVTVLDEMEDMRLSQTLEALRKVVSGFRRLRGVSCPLPPSCTAGCGRVARGVCGACRVRRHRAGKQVRSET